MGPRAILRLAAALVWLAVCMAGWAIARLVGREAFWVCAFPKGAARLLGLRVSVTGVPVRGPVLYVANHISWLDIIALGSVAPVRFVAKDQIAGWPLVGAVARAAGTVFVSRERRTATRMQADAIVAALGGCRPVCLFAEGGTGDGTAVLPFRPALFVSPAEAGVPVQPVAIDYGPDRARYAWPDGTSFSTEAKRMLARAEAVPVTVRFLPPLDATALDRKTLASRAQMAVAGALAEADRQCDRSQAFEPAPSVPSLSKDALNR